MSERLGVAAPAHVRQPRAVLLAATSIFCELHRLADDPVPGDDAA